MSEMLSQLKQVINSDNPPPVEAMRIKYARMRQRSEQLTTAAVKAGKVPPGQGCAYPAGFPV